MAQTGKRFKLWQAIVRVLWTILPIHLLQVLLASALPFPEPVSLLPLPFPASFTCILEAVSYLINAALQWLHSLHSEICPVHLHDVSHKLLLCKIAGVGNGTEAMATDMCLQVFNLHGLCNWQLNQVDSHTRFQQCITGPNP